LPTLDAANLLEENRTSRQTIGVLLGRFLPRRVAGNLIGSELADRRIDQLNSGHLASLAQKLGSWPVMFGDSEGYDRAEVTLGGVSTRELSSRTMQTKSVPGLFFIGEVVDVTGWLGGYNFQWAWASGHAAGQAV
jgi:predicted flavoprotein YhiN